MRTTVLLTLACAIGCAGPAPASTPHADATAPDTHVPDSIAPDSFAPDTHASDIADATGAGGIPLADLVTAVLDAHCDPAGCQGHAGGAGFLTTAACRAFLGDSATAGVAALVAKAQAGQLAYDPVQAAACVAHHRSQCRFAFAPAPPPPPCRAMFTGTAQPGAACDAGDDCASEWCDRTEAPAAHCKGVCRDPVGLGQACTETAGCVQGLACIGATCQADLPGGSGAACGEPTGDSGATCAAGLYCDVSGAQPTCQPQRKPGAPCDDTGACLPGTTCFFRRSGPSLCQPHASTGQLCSGFDARTGPGGGCVAGLVCATLDPDAEVPEHRCLPRVALGQPCQVQAQCGAKDAVCAGAALGKAGVCQLVPKLGETCWPAAQCCGQGLVCFPGAACDPGTERCVPAPPHGQACVGGACGGAASCWDGTCVRPALAGEACGVLALCADGLECGGATCAPVACAKPQK